MNNKKSILQERILSSLKKNPHGRLHLAPRLGKTKIVISIIKRDNPNSILWVSPSAKLIKEDLKNEFIKWDGIDYIDKLSTSTYKSLHKISGHFDFVVLDEEQFVTDKNMLNFFNNSLTYNNIISMTGTPTKNPDKNLIYNLLNLDVLYQFDINEAVKEGILSNYNIKVINVNISRNKKIEVGKKGAKFFVSEKDNYDYLTSIVDKKPTKFNILNRMRAIKNSPSKIDVIKKLNSKLEGKKLIFCSYIEQAEDISKYTYHSKGDDKYFKQFKEGIINEIAMVDSGGVGETYRNIDHLLFMQCDSGINGKSIQKIARTLLYQEDYTANIWILRLKGTKDEAWVEKALDNFDPQKIEVINSDKLFA